MSFGRELWLSRAAMTTTVVAAVVACFVCIDELTVDLEGGMWALLACVIAVPLLYGNLVYQVSRFGALRRQQAHQPVARDELEQLYARNAPSLTVLVPSYREEPHILKQTILSAALLEYPGRRVSVLIDDPPEDPASRRASWGVVAEVDQMLAEPASTLREANAAYLQRQSKGKLETAAEIERLLRLHEGLAEWFEARAAEFERIKSQQFAHADKFFVEYILRARAREQRKRAHDIRECGADLPRIAHEYRRLAALLRVEISGFERKVYVNLSHAPNKAMNLNTYLGLIGKCWRSERSADGVMLVECAPDAAELAVPATDCVLTLDADSVLLSDYALRLVHAMMSGERIAVAQTPYSAFPGAPTCLERMAGATTDIQFVAHQGSSHFDAAYWVGANALLRFVALEEVKTWDVERGYPVPVFIQDRTVIEDTGSTVDLISKDWTIFNYPERLAYSATPPDFGTLIIQRRRWSNGGLLILPDLLRYCRSSRVSLAQAFVRAHYLLSPTIGSLGVLLLLLCPVEPHGTVGWLALAAAPYYGVYGRDLVRSGYRWTDLLRVYALTLLLLPVNLAGVVLSLRQALTGRKASFGRTPKIEDRTAVPPFYFGFNVAMLIAVLASVAYALVTGHYLRLIFPSLNIVAYTRGLATMIGWRKGWQDAAAALRLRRRAARTVRQDPETVIVPVLDRIRVAK
jgi:cellulose synthase/poly-beta-1,6-N-acetylglucosamine synthase-like glycosyltransferase